MFNFFRRKSAPAAYENLTAAEFSEQMRGGVVLDVRTPAEYASGHLPGAVNIDVSGGRFDQEIATLDTDPTYYVYCRSGARSARACQRMHAAGFDRLHNLRGGIMAYDGPLEK